MKNLFKILTFSIFLSIGLGCVDEVEVELWGDCYNIETTTFINLSYQEGSDYPPLSGEIPSEIGQLVNMTDLYLGGNELTLIPNQIGNLVNLQSLFLYDNQFADIPSEIGNLTNLRTLDLGYNQITELPNELFSLGDLELLRLEYNRLTSIPNDLCNLLGCNIFIDNNHICPPYPECLTEDDVGYQDTLECLEYQLGDVNIDGLLDILDIVIGVNILLDIVEYTDEQYELLDYNQDGECNILDLVRIIDYILGD